MNCPLKLLWFSFVSAPSSTIEFASGSCSTIASTVYWFKVLSYSDVCPHSAYSERAKESVSRWHVKVRGGGQGGAARVTRKRVKRGEWCERDARRLTRGEARQEMRSPLLASLSPITLLLGSLSFSFISSPHLHHS